MKKKVISSFLIATTSEINMGKPYKKATPSVAPTLKPYVPAPHPQQARIDDIRIIPSLVTPNPQFIPRGK